MGPDRYSLKEGTGEVGLFGSSGVWPAGGAQQIVGALYYHTAVIELV